MVVNIQEVKDKIIGFLDEKGPNLPIPVAKSLNIQTMLASAVLSELISEKRITISHLRIGNSPLYYLPGQEAKLEPFSNNLNGVEKDACNKLKENQILIDEELEPVTRVALRHIKDFAFSFQEDNKLIWRYFLVKEFDAKEILRKSRIPAERIVIDVSQKISHKQEAQQIHGIRDVSQSMWQDIEKVKYKEDIREKMGRIAEEIAEKQKELDIAKQEILDKIESAERKVGENPEVEKLRQEIIERTTEHYEKKVLEKPIVERIEKKGKKKDPKQEFLAEVKAHLLIKGIELVSIEGLNKSEILMKVKDNNQVYLLFSLNKKKVVESDVIKAHRKALKLRLPYSIAAKGDLNKKDKEKIEAFKSLLGIMTIGAQ